MKISSIVLLCTFFVFLNNIVSHPTLYPEVDRNKVCFENGPAKIYSYHLHMLFFQNSESSINKALKVREKFANNFGLSIEENNLCKDLFHNEYPCVFSVDKEPAGPFLTGQWSVYFLEEQFKDYASWIMQHREGLDILIHPNTGCQFEDHSWWALWGGNVWPIDLSNLSYDKPFNSKIFEDENKKTLQRINKSDLLKNENVSDLIKMYVKEHESQEFLYSK